LPSPWSSLAFHRAALLVACSLWTPNTPPRTPPPRCPPSPGAALHPAARQSCTHPCELVGKINVVTQARVGDVLMMNATIYRSGFRVECRVCNNICNHRLLSCSALVLCPIARFDVPQLSAIYVPHYDRSYPPPPGVHGGKFAVHGFQHGLHTTRYRLIASLHGHSARKFSYKVRFHQANRRYSCPCSWSF